MGYFKFFQEIHTDLDFAYDFLEDQSYQENGLLIGKMRFRHQG
jgi:hypothetical protein